MLKNKKRSDNRLQSKVYLGNGEYKYVYAKTQKELEKKVAELKLKLNKGFDISESNSTFEFWAQIWLKGKKVTLSAGRFEVCKYRLNNLASIQNYPINKIRPTDIQDIIYKMLEDNYSEYVMREVKNTAKQIFQLAIDNRVIDFNPATAVKIPKGKPAETRRALTEEEQEWINEPSDNRGHRAAMIMMYAGLRRGELIPLLWSDINLEKGTINVNKAVEMIKGKSVIKDITKTEAGMRTVFIPQKLIEFLRNEERGTSFYVCPNAYGKIMSESAFRRMWESYIYDINLKHGNFGNIIIKNPKTDKIENFTVPSSKYAPKKVPIVIEKITPHMLRHTFITMMYFAGVDILTAKEQAGHSDVQTTLNIYTHLDSLHKNKQIDKLDEYLKKRG